MFLIKNCLVFVVLAGVAVILLQLEDGVQGADGPSSAPDSRYDEARERVLQQAMAYNLFESESVARREQIKYDEKCASMCAEWGFNTPAVRLSYWCVTTNSCDSSFTKNKDFWRYGDRDDDSRFAGCCCCGHSEASCASQISPFGWVPGF